MAIQRRRGRPEHDSAFRRHAPADSEGILEERGRRAGSSTVTVTVANTHDGARRRLRPRLRRLRRLLPPPKPLVAANVGDPAVDLRYPGSWAEALRLDRRTWSGTTPMVYSYGLGPLRQLRWSAPRVGYDLLHVPGGFHRCRLDHSSHGDRLEQRRLRDCDLGGRRGGLPSAKRASQRSRLEPSDSDAGVERRAHHHRRRWRLAQHRFGWCCRRGCRPTRMAVTTGDQIISGKNFPAREPCHDHKLPRRDAGHGRPRLGTGAANAVDLLTSSGVRLRNLVFDAKWDTVGLKFDTGSHDLEAD